MKKLLITAGLLLAALTSQAQTLAPNQTDYIFMTKTTQAELYFKRGTFKLDDHKGTAAGEFVFFLFDGRRDDYGAAVYQGDCMKPAGQLNGVLLQFNAQGEALPPLVWMNHGHGMQDWIGLNLCDLYLAAQKH